MSRFIHFILNNFKSFNFGGDSFFQQPIFSYQSDNFIIFAQRVKITNYLVEVYTSHESSTNKNYNLSLNILI